MEKVYIEQNTDGVIRNSDLYAAYVGFTRKGYEIEYYRTIEIVDVEAESIVCGTWPSIRKAWVQLGVEPAIIPDYPPSLRRHLGRDVAVDTLTNIRFLYGSGYRKPLFIKPMERRGLFPGMLVTAPEGLAPSAKCDGGVAVWVSEPLEPVTEYRVFVRGGEVVGCKHIKGDYRLPIDHGRVERVVSEYADAPVAYALDFALTASGDTVLLRVCDVFAMRSYGLGGVPYADMIEARWREIAPH
jgi:hypothetical protein